MQLVEPMSGIEFDTMEFEFVELQPLPEATTGMECLDLLQRIYTEGLPGFVIRAAGLIDTSITTQEELAKAVIDLLPHLDTDDEDDEPFVYEVIGDDTLRPKLERHSGDIHFDQRPGGMDGRQVRIHRTLEGGGIVRIANSGTLGKDFENPINYDAWKQAQNFANETFDWEDVDPQFLNPNIYSAYLNSGDTVVFPTTIEVRDSHDKAGPVWHKFDTEEAPRSARLMVVGATR